jgi:hypothetical protein
MVRKGAEEARFYKNFADLLFFSYFLEASFGKIFPLKKDLDPETRLFTMDLRFHVKSFPPFGSP